MGKKPTSSTRTGIQLPLARFLFLAQILLLAESPQTVKCLNNGLARTPPMGWLAWERFICTIDCITYPNDCIQSKLFEEMADELVKRNLFSFGYQYVNIDDCWSELKRDNQSGRLVPDKKRFVNGIKALSDKIHSLGLKLGIYGDCGSSTCGGYPAQLKPNNTKPEQENYFELDAQTFAEWQIDSFKFDGCYIDPIKAESVCPRMSWALNGTGRPVLLVCEWPFYMMYAHGEPDFAVAAESCNVWRYYDDIEDSWASILNTIDYTVKHQSTIVKYHGPGHWFDPDQLVIGNDGLSSEQEHAQMAVWSMWSAPLYMSNDLRTLSKSSETILKNRHLIDVDQDPLGVLALMVNETYTFYGNLQVFVKPVMPIRNGCPSFVVLYLNRRSIGTAVKISFKLRDLLLGAPISQAALTQEELLEVDGGGDDATDTESNDSGIETGTSRTQSAAGPLINVSSCLERLEKAMSKFTSAEQHSSASASADSSSSSEYSRLEFNLTDLMAGGANLGRLAINADLMLTVKPSGVRVVRLVEAI